MGIIRSSSPGSVPSSWSTSGSNHPAGEVSDQYGQAGMLPGLSIVTEPITVWPSNCHSAVSGAADRHPGIGAMSMNL